MYAGVMYHSHRETPVTSYDEDHRRKEEETWKQVRGQVRQKVEKDMKNRGLAVDAPPVQAAINRAVDHRVEKARSRKATSDENKEFAGAVGVGVGMAVMAVTFNPGAAVGAGMLARKLAKLMSSD
jgi:hypothetical protein